VSIGCDLEESLFWRRRLIQKSIRRRWKIREEIFVIGDPINLLRHRLLIRRLGFGRKQLNRIDLMISRINLMTNRINLMTDGINLFGEAFFGRASHRVNAEASFQVRLRVVP
jgi:hypothetical protein